LLIDIALNMFGLYYLLLKSNLFILVNSLATYFAHFHMMVMESFTLTSSLPFNVEETELYELTELAGVTIDPKVFKLV